jgi:hypothetical protein
MKDFDLEAYLSNSKALDVTDLAWHIAANYPLTEGERRCLTYMMDIEMHTIVYLRDLLNTRAIKDGEIGDFLPCWLYEESYHGRALERLLRACGTEVSPQRAVEVRSALGWQDRFYVAATALLSAASRDFTAVHMTWGAIQELSTLTAYGLMVARTKHPLLAEILRRIIRQESRHFNFYYHQAARRLQSKSAQQLTSAMLKLFWGPVGSSVRPREEVDFIITFAFSDEAGAKAIERMDRVIGQLPGLGWCDLFRRVRQSSMQRQMASGSRMDFSYSQSAPERTK